MIERPKKVALMSEKEVVSLYNGLNETLRRRTPTLLEVYKVIKRKDELRNEQRVSCESEIKLFIAAVAEKNKLLIDATYDKKVSADERPRVERMIKIMERLRYGQDKMARYLDLPTDTIYRIRMSKIEGPKNKQKHEDLKERRKLEAKIEPQKKKPV